MYLQLAEKPKRKKGDVFVGAYKRKSNVLPHVRRYPLLNEMNEICEGVYLAGRSERKARRDEKKDQKATNKANREQRKEDKNERKNQRQTARDERKANRKPIDFGGIVDSASGLIGKFKKGGADGGDEMPMDVPTSKPFYKNPIVIIGGLVVVGGLIYLGTRKK
jgi:hypothetical protein